MGCSALSHGIPGSHAAALASQQSARAGQRREGSSGCVKFKKRREGQCIQCSEQQFVPDETKAYISQPVSVTFRRPHFSSPRTYFEANLSPSEKFWVIAASTTEELLAAATLRAQIFYTYPQADITVSGMEGVKARMANDFLANDLLKSRVKSEFSRESKFEALGMRVKCLLAVCRQSALEALSLSGGRVAIPSHLVPPSVSSVDMNGDEPLVAIGTLDIQDGTGTKATADVNLVTFQLYALAHKAQHMKKQVHKGKKGAKSYFPVEQEDTLEQAYIFNVCVIKDARRIGVAKALLVAALKVAKQMELQILFVHVEADNQSALALYNSLGYAVEEEESVEVESLLRSDQLWFVLELLSEAGYLACILPNLSWKFMEEEDFVFKHHPNYETDDKFLFGFLISFVGTRSATSELQEVHYLQERLQRTAAALVAWSSCRRHSLRGDDITFECPPYRSCGESDRS